MSLRDDIIETIVKRLFSFSDHDIIRVSKFGCCCAMGKNSQPVGCETLMTSIQINRYKTKNSIDEFYTINTIDIPLWSKTAGNHRWLNDGRQRAARLIGYAIGNIPFGFFYDEK